MPKEKTMTQEAMVIERTVNGIIVRPYYGWWQGAEDRAVSANEVRVFNDLKDFERFFAEWFPKG